MSRVMIELKQATTQADFEAIEHMANIVMPEVYEGLVKPEHIKSFLYKYQRVEAITKQVNEDNYQYYLIYLDGKLTGYVGIQLHTDHIHLSKLYVLKEFRGNKLGKAALDHIERVAQVQGLSYIDLYVHIGNTGSVEVYKKMGYVIAETLVNQYGEGYDEKEYRMVKDV